MTVEQAKQFRKNSTDAERALWRVLRSRQLGGHKFRRQQPLGSFIADFVCLEARLIVEVEVDSIIKKKIEPTALHATAKRWKRSSGSHASRRSCRAWSSRRRCSPPTR